MCKEEKATKLERKRKHISIKRRKSRQKRKMVKRQPQIIKK
jgi:hypothetical protein